MIKQGTLYHVFLRTFTKSMNHTDNSVILSMDNINETSFWNTTNITEVRNTTSQPVHDCGLFRFILYALTMGLTCILGFTGNSISFLVLGKDRVTPVASFLLKALAVADNCFLVLWMIHYSVREWMRYFNIAEQGLHPSWLYIRVYSFPILYMAQTLTIWMTVVLALNRFMAVCLPYKAPHLCSISNVYKEVAITVFLSIIYNVPRFFELKVVKTESPIPKWNRTALGRNHIYEIIYTDALYYIFSFVLPLLILAYVNTRVILAYKAMQARKHRMLSRRSDRENNITLVMIVVVVIFMLCQAPARIVQLVWNYTYSHCLEYQFYLIHISNTLEVLNSSLNFIIFCTFHTRFREAFFTRFCSRFFSSYRRRESTRFTTTEGMSMEQIKGNTVFGKRSVFLKKDKTRNSPARNGNIQGHIAVQILLNTNGNGGEYMKPLQEFNEPYDVDELINDNINNGTEPFQL